MMLSHLLTISAIAFVAFLSFLVLLNLIGLPANWIVVALLGIYVYFFPTPSMDLVFWILVIGLAGLGEVLEWLVMAKKSKESGASSLGTFCGMVGAFLGAIVGTPFLLGIGAFIGALLGAYGGCLALELVRGKGLDEAKLAAKGTFMGRFLGSMCKCCAGFSIALISARHILGSF